MNERDLPADIRIEELQLATRNHGMPLEALRWDLTPVGLHYLLIHYDIQLVDPATWRLSVGGAVRSPATLSLDDIRARPRRDVAVTMECAGNGRALMAPRAFSQPWLIEAVGTARWTGTPLWPLLEELGVDDDAVEVAFTALDHGVEGDVEQDYARSLSLEEARREEVLLAYEINGVPLPPQHGFPLRLIVPGWYGMTNVKWLSRITVLDEEFAGYQQVRGYRWRTDPDDPEPSPPLQRIRPRSLMVPPGHPDFLTRTRFVPVADGAVTIEGRAWSGGAPITAVDVSSDGGRRWHPAELGPAMDGDFAWRRWTWTWTPSAAGEYELCCRATDATGERQPDTPVWNVGGYANNAVQRVPVTVV